MSGPVLRAVAQVVISGVGVLSRAFIGAYQQAAANAKRGAPAGADMASKAAKAVTNRNGMKAEEALSVLKLGKTYTPEEVEDNFARFFAANDPKEGGSFYLQSKVFRAKERLDMIAGVEAAAAAPDDAPPSDEAEADAPPADDTAAPPKP